MMSMVRMKVAGLAWSATSESNSGKECHLNDEPLNDHNSDRYRSGHPLQ